jgi:haloalkane dehalogenase
MATQALRTPDERFENLPGYNFAPHYIEVDGLRMHYVDEGDSSASIILMLHGEPSWSYLYRKMIPIFVDAGYRAIAPDLIGFGRSDKLPNRGDYTYQNHMNWLTGFLTGLDLQGVTLVCQDWGGLLGLRLVAENPDRFVRVVAANTFLPTGDLPAGEAFLRWRDFSQNTPRFDAGRIVKGGCQTELSPEVIAAYNAPFPDESYLAAARQFPTLVPISPDDPATEANRRAWTVLQNWTKPFHTAFSDSDPVTKGGDRYFQHIIPGARHDRHTTITGAGHFLQEDKGEELAHAVLGFMQS